MDVDKEKVLAAYQFYSNELNLDDLKEFRRDQDFTALCHVREVLSKLDLTHDEAQLVYDADCRLAAAFDTATLTSYADYYPDLPIREWWSYKHRSK